ncbi:hypothetical protein LCGC14_2033380 [marine sediment metagenome]|uniref:Uncharacterized protein n=1 Tax=marine sediment metagenome TaxID=412755 RepID=A0A0F9HQZ9_9ZZZZ
MEFDLPSYIYGWISAATGVVIGAYIMWVVQNRRPFLFCDECGKYRPHWRKGSCSVCGAP